jgi:hypothetical protein
MHCRAALGFPSGRPSQKACAGFYQVNVTPCPALPLGLRPDFATQNRHARLLFYPDEEKAKLLGKPRFGHWLAHTTSCKAAFGP